MTDDSLSAFSRVRLYTAIYPEGDVADSTESFFCNCLEHWADFPVLSLREMKLKRLPSVNPLRYQSPIALFLGAKLKMAPATIAQAICQESVATDDLNLSWNEVGWITVTWASAAMMQALEQLCRESVVVETAVPFWLWQVSDRVRSLREQLRSLHPEFEVFDLELSISMNKIPDPAWGLLEAMVVFFDRRSEGQSLLGELRSLCDAFEQMHRQIPLFSVETSVGDRYAVWLVLGWFQRILGFRGTTDK